MVTIGMDRVHFKLPIFLKHLVSIRARICRVRYVYSQLCSLASMRSLVKY